MVAAAFGSRPANTAIYHMPKSHLSLGGVFYTSHSSSSPSPPQWLQQAPCRPIRENVIDWHVACRRKVGCRTIDVVQVEHSVRAFGLRAAPRADLCKSFRSGRVQRTFASERARRAFGAMCAASLRVRSARSACVRRTCARPPSSRVRPGLLRVSFECT